MVEVGVDRVVEEFFRPMRGVLDYVFAAGVTYGAGRLAGLCYDCWKGFRIYSLPWGRCTRSDLKTKFGEWAVIVGATSGIGQAFAEELASRGMNVVLISKVYDDLVNLVAKIQTEYSVEAYGIYADFTIGLHVYQEIADALQDLEIGVLVNDASVNYDHPQYFVLVPPTRLRQILDENVSAATLMTYLLLPQMLERQRGAVINVCSQITLLPPSPLLSAYTASMVYLQCLSECLSLESQRRGVLVQTLLPGCVANERCSSSSSSSSTFFTPSATTYVEHALATLGVVSTTCGYWPHSLQSWLAGCVPRGLWVWFISRLLRRQRIQRISEAKEKGVEQFAKRRKTSLFGAPLLPSLPLHHRTSISAPAPTAAGATQPVSLRRVSGDLTLRRSPSPKRRTGVVGTPAANFQSGTPAPLRLQETPFPPLAGANVPSPIPESPVTPHFFHPGGPQNQQPPSTSTPLSGTARGLNIGAKPPPMASPALKRPRSPFRYSRVTVMPSLVRYSQQAQLPTSLPLEPSPPPPPPPPPSSYNPVTATSGVPSLSGGEPVRGRGGGGGGRGRGEEQQDSLPPASHYNKPTPVDSNSTTTSTTNEP